MKADLEYLTSKELAGRASLTPGSKVAAGYVAKEFAKAGIVSANSGSYFQEFELTANTLDAAKSGLTFGALQLTATEAFTGGFHKNITVAGAAVFAGYGISAPEYGYDDYAGIDVKGKIVLVLDREPQEDLATSVFLGKGLTRYGSTRAKLFNAQARGAIGLVVLPSAASTYVTGQPASPARGNAARQMDDGIQIPIITLRALAADQLLPNRVGLQQQIDQKLINVSVELPFPLEIRLEHSAFHKDKSWNVVGILEGSDKKLRAETVLVTSHYDHLPERGVNYYPGANDNASGTVAVIELARLFGKLHRRPKRSILFVSFGSEENGLLGSYYYVAHPLRPLETTRAVINLDMIARDEAHTSGTEGKVTIAADSSMVMNLAGAAYSPDFAQMIEKANKTTKFTFDTKFDRDSTQTVLYRCDHYPFLLANVPAIWIFGGFHPGYHEPVDTVDKLNFAKLEKVVQLTFQTVVGIGNTARPPEFVKVAKISVRPWLPDDQLA